MGITSSDMSEGILKFFSMVSFSFPLPFLSSYEDVRAEMNRDLQYRLNSRTARTSLGRPLYYRINVQMITTQRGFQSNSKVVTTTDTMLEVVVNMKR